MGVADAGDAMSRASGAFFCVLCVVVVALGTMGFECGPPGRDLPCTNQIVEGDVLHIEVVGRYAQDGGIWAGGDFNGFGSIIPSCVGIDSLTIGTTFDAKIHGSREDMLCTQLGFVPLWDAPQFGSAVLPVGITPAAGAGSSEVMGSEGAITAPAGCVGLYGISLITTTGDIFAEPSFTRPYGTFLKRYFGTWEPEACGPDFVGHSNPGGATYCGDMYLVRVTR